MVEIIFGILFFIFAVVTVIIILPLHKEERKFQKNKIYTEGVIVGYVREDYTKWDTPQVLINIDGKEEICRCKSKNMTANTYPHGTKVRITYCKKIKFNTEFYDVRIVEDEFAPYSVNTTITALLALAILLLVAAIVMTIIGVNTLQ